LLGRLPGIGNGLQMDDPHFFGLPNPVRAGNGLRTKPLSLQHLILLMCHYTHDLRWDIVPNHIACSGRILMQDAPKRIHKHMAESIKI
jgi:hypothetical protein